jgi:type II secretory ATPase GspE/PulE/Tfp pilus assembly ATPase PilB-like protein
VIKELVSRGESFEVFEAAAQEEGMVTLVEDGIAKAAQAQTTIEEVVEVAQQQ